MSSNPSDLRAVRDAGFAALNRGDYCGAGEQFARVLAAGAGDAAVWYGLSLARRHQGAMAEENAALDQALALDARHLPALIRKGDLYAARGDERAACSYYGTAVRLAAAHPSLAPEWRREVQRAESAARQISGRFEAHLQTTLAACGFGGPGTERFSRALDMLLGKRQVYLQQPKQFYFPELPQIQFYDRRDFPWAAALEAATARIRTELRALLASGSGFVPYIRTVPDRPSFGNPLLESLDWSAGFLIKDGAEVSDNAARCPDTMAALSGVPLCRIPGRTPSVLFSLLRPGTRIRPHHGYTNARLICHLPLIVPADCALRVGNETRPWREGELVVFDDSMEHEAWNLSREQRVVLLFDVWRPELSERERALVAATLEAVGRFDGAAGAWND
jgi:aspartyl/asparaginyl beta-hydroxylase (cupin superfamily)